MSISAFNPAAVAPTSNAPALNASANSFPAANQAIDTSDSFNSSVSPLGQAPFANAAPTANAPVLNAPAMNAPTMNAPTMNAPAANAAPAVMPPSYNQMPASNAPPVTTVPVQAKSSSGGLFGTIAAGLAGGLGALKFIVPKFLPSLLKNPSTLKSFGIFGAGAAAAILGFGFIKNKLMGGASQAAAAQQFPPEAMAQLQQLLAAGVPPQALMQQGVPVEALRQAGAQV